MKPIHLLFRKPLALEELCNFLLHNAALSSESKRYGQIARRTIRNFALHIGTLIGLEEAPLLHEIPPLYFT